MSSNKSATDTSADDANPSRLSHRDHAFTLDELAGNCFGCGPGNEHGLRLQFTTDAEAGTATATLNLDRFFEGPPGHIHGGIIATLLDEAMSKLNRPLGVLAMTRSLEVEYLHPSPLFEPLLLVARHVRRDGRKLFHEAELKLADGTILARGHGLFIVVRKHEG